MVEDQPELDKESVLNLNGEDRRVFVEALLNPPEPNEALKSAVEQFEESFHDRSFSARNPELGKMIKCDGCGLRHRSSIVHERKFATDIRGVSCEPRIAQPKQYRHQANRYGWCQRPNPLILLLTHAARKNKVIE